MKRMGIDALIGETLVGVTGLSKGSDVVAFTAASGRTFELYHEQDCCESVEVEDVTGAVDAIIGSPILEAREDTNRDDNKPHEYADSWTWTFYTIRTVNGTVVIRWLGESNGYYGESVDFRGTPA